MRAMIQCMHENNYQNITFPSGEKELQVLCDSLGIGNSAKTVIKIGTVHNDETLSTLLFDKTVNLDELNFLMKRLTASTKRSLPPFMQLPMPKKLKQ